MMIQTQYLLLFLAILFFSCEPAAPPEPRADKLAKSLCGCTSKLLALNKQAQASADSLSFRNIVAEFETARSCAAGLGIKPDERAALELALVNLCPALAVQQELLAELLGQ